MSYTVDEQAIAQMESMAAKMLELSEKIHQETALLKSTFEENVSGLGPHTASIRALLDEVGETEEEASVPVKKLVLKLTRAALIRRKIIEENRYTASKGRSR